MAQTTKRHTHTHNITQKQCTWSEFRKQINFYFLKHKYLHTFSSFIFNRLSSFQMDFFFFAMFSCCSSLFFRVLSKRSKMYIICLGELFNTSWLIPLHCDTFFPFLLHFFLFPSHDFNGFDVSANNFNESHLKDGQTQNDLNCADVLFYWFSNALLTIFCFDIWIRPFQGTIAMNHHWNNEAILTVRRKDFYLYAYPYPFLSIDSYALFWRIVLFVISVFQYTNKVFLCD